MANLHSPDCWRRRPKYFSMLAENVSDILPPKLGHLKKGYKMKNSPHWTRKCRSKILLFLPEKNFHLIGTILGPLKNFRRHSYKKLRILTGSSSAVANKRSCNCSSQDHLVVWNRYFVVTDSECSKYKVLALKNWEKSFHTKKKKKKLEIILKKL